MADNVPITAGSGTNVASDDVGGVQYQRVKLTRGPDGTATDVSDSSPLQVAEQPHGTTYGFWIPNGAASQVFVAAANTVHWDLFNADVAAVVRVLSVRHVPDIVTAVTGVAVQWKIAKTTAVGTGGAAQTAFKADENDAALNANITCRSKPTGGATEGTIIQFYGMSSEETNTATTQVAAMGGLELVPPDVAMRGIVLRQNQGLRVTQITSTAAGDAGWLVVFSVE